MYIGSESTTIYGNRQEKTEYILHIFNKNIRNKYLIELFFHFEVEDDYFFPNIVGNNKEFTIYCGIIWNFLWDVRVFLFGVFL